ncbi:hypothetical protein [Clostridium estertheticum]|nr:hypothetical protein [Clostridium estertheticum]
MISLIGLGLMRWLLDLFRELKLNKMIDLSRGKDVSDLNIEEKI